MINLSNPSHVFILALLFAFFGWLNYWVARKKDFTVVIWVCFWIIVTASACASLVEMIARSL